MCVYILLYVCVCVSEGESIAFKAKKIDTKSILEKTFENCSNSITFSLICC